MPATKLTLEGPEGKKGPWPWIVTPTVTNATATCPIESGVEAPYKFTEKFSDFPIEVSLKGNAAHRSNPNFHRGEQFTAGAKRKKACTRRPKRTVSPATIGSKEAEPVCHYEDSFTFNRAK